MFGYKSKEQVYKEALLNYILNNTRQESKDDAASWLRLLITLAEMKAELDRHPELKDQAIEITKKMEEIKRQLQEMEGSDEDSDDSSSEKDNSDSKDEDKKDEE